MHLSLQQIRQDTIYRAITGSHAYGLATPKSDLDVRGVCLVRSPRHYLGLGKQVFQQQDKREDANDDTVIYEFRRAMDLFASGNPNMVEMLFVGTRQQILVRPEFRPVVERRHALVTRRLGQNFVGYGRHQFEDLKRQRMQLSDAGTVELFLSRLGERRRESFNRALGYDTKKAMHTVRTLTMASEIFNEGVVHVERRDAAVLGRVREGAWSFDELLEWVEATMQRVTQEAAVCALPLEVDRQAWDDLTVAVIEDAVWPGARQARRGGAKHVD